MANHKRKRPKNARGGCLMCKYYKVNGFGKNNPHAYKHSDVVRLRVAKDDIETHSYQ